MGNLQIFASLYFPLGTQKYSKTLTDMDESTSQLVIEESVFHCMIIIVA